VQLRGGSKLKLLSPKETISASSLLLAGHQEELSQRESELGGRRRRLV